MTYLSSSPAFPRMHSTLLPPSVMPVDHLSNLLLLLSCKIHTTTTIIAFSQFSRHYGDKQWVTCQEMRCQIGWNIIRENFHLTNFRSLSQRECVSITFLVYCLHVLWTDWKLLVPGKCSTLAAMQRRTKTKKRMTTCHRRIPCHRITYFP